MPTHVSPSLPSRSGARLPTTYRDPSIAHDLADTCPLNWPRRSFQLDPPGMRWNCEPAADPTGPARRMLELPLTALMVAYRVGSHFIWKTVAAACAC